MVDLALLQSVSYIAGALGVCVAATYYVMNLRIGQKNQELSLKTQEHTLETRQTQLTMQLYEKMSTKEYMDTFTEILQKWTWSDYNDFKSKYGVNGNPEKYAKFSSMCMDFEQIGILMKHGSFNPNMFYAMWGVFYNRFWEKIEPVVIGINMEGESLGGFLEYAEDLYYFFAENRFRDRADFKVRETARLEKRAKLGLKPRPSYIQ
jgi:hypothetical protein